MYDARCVTIHITYKYRDFVFGVSGVLCGTLRQLYLKRLLTLRLNGLLRRRLLSLRVYGCVRCTMCNDSYYLQVP